MFSPRGQGAEELLTRPPFGRRNEREFLRLVNVLTAHHLRGCPEYARIWPEAKVAATIEEAPFLHAEVFKQLKLKTQTRGIDHQRTLRSSATGKGDSSMIALDSYSNLLQSRSAGLILAEFIGPDRQPLFILDNLNASLRKDEISARFAAAMSLCPLSSEIVFLLSDPDEPLSVEWNEFLKGSRDHRSLIVYGSTWILWNAWKKEKMPDGLRRKLKNIRIQFVHSGGWKKLEAEKVSRREFDRRLLTGTHPESKVLDFYGLAEQPGMVFPFCRYQFRHLPLWADLVVRDIYSLRPTPPGVTGQLQFINLLAYGAPYHSVLTEDLGKLVPGRCPCGREGKRFVFLGRIPQAALRGCANV